MSCFHHCPQTKTNPHLPLPVPISERMVSESSSTLPQRTTWGANLDVGGLEGAGTGAVGEDDEVPLDHFGSCFVQQPVILPCRVWAAGHKVNLSSANEVSSHCNKDTGMNISLRPHNLISAK